MIYIKNIINEKALYYINNDFLITITILLYGKFRQTLFNLAQQAPKTV